VYAGEQSRDAFLLALDAATLQERWRVRLADRIGSSEVPATDDMYAAYTLPGVYGLDVLADGGVLVSAVHAWGLSDDERRNASQLVLLADDGEERGVWPPSPVSATFLHPRVSGDRVAVQVGRSASGPAPVLASGPLPVGGVQVLRLPTLEPAARFTLSPLAPYYTSVFLWDATAVVGDRVVVGTTDGRVVGVDAQGLVDWQRDLGTPIVQGDVPVAAPVGNAVAVASGVAAVVGGSNVPYGATTSAATPPSPHLQANSLHVLDPVTAQTAWTWRGQVGLGGVSASPDGALLALGTADGGEQDWRGALLFRADGAGSGEERLLARCPTEGRVFFRHDVSLDGRVAVVEVPWRDGDRVAGAYRVTVLR